MLQIKLITDCNKQPKYTERLKTKVQPEFKRRQTNQKHVNGKSQGRQVGRDQWTPRGNSEKEDFVVQNQRMLSFVELSVQKTRHS